MQTWKLCSKMLHNFHNNPMQIQNQGSFTRGSQLYAHKFRMFGQGTKNSLIAGLVCAIGWLLWRMYQHLSLVSVYYLVIERYVQLKLAIGRHFYPLSKIGIEFYHFEKKDFVYSSAKEYIYYFWHVMPYGSSITSFWHWCIYSALLELSAIFIIGVLVTTIFFIQRGRQIIGIAKIRGGDLVETKVLARILRKVKMASNIVISGLPLVKDSETQHILLTGTTGSGKTNMLNELLPQIRKQDDRAIIFDLTGSFVDRFFDGKTDILLNPFEENTENWLPWNDCQEDFEFDALASAFIDGEGFSDKYWEEAAQKVLSEALNKQKDSKDLTALLNILTKVSLTEFCKYFEGTSAAGLVSKEGEKGTASVRATLINKIARLKYLKDGGKFSIKHWINNGQGWLFITAPPNQRDTLRPLVSAWIDIAIKGLMERSPEAINQKMWFILGSVDKNYS
ncbi:MAG: type IV secretion system DNA-binding domain-containing protein [Rickettsiaceae bacterium]|nr:type IV secretion system DNA-binding domain-containing protein [Rickettsiaceae bacterium]